MSAVDSRGQPLKIGDKVDRHGNAGTVTAMGKTDNMVVVTFDNGSRTYVQDTDRELVKKGSKMATRKSPKKAPTRRKAAEDEEVVRDLQDEGNPAELKADEEFDPLAEAKDDAPFDPKHSAIEAAKAHGNLKAIKDYFGEGGEGDLTKMDHPGMRDGLKALLDEEGPLDKAMQHIKDLISEHHSELGDPDEAIGKMCKSLEEGKDEPYNKAMPPDGEPGDDLVTGVDDFDPTEKDEAPPFVDDEETKDDSFESGEGNLVGSGAIPEGDLDPEKDGTAGDDTEEILERYQNPKTGKRMTRKAGIAWRAKNGRVYVKLAPAVVRKTVRKDFGEDEEGKDLTDTGNPAELKGEVTDEHLDAIGKAADHLDDAAADAATPKMHKSAHSFHSKALRKTLDDLGNPAELKDGPPDGETNGNLAEGVEELKDVDEEETKAKQATCRSCGWEGPMPGDPLTARCPDCKMPLTPAKAKKSLSPTVAKVLEELRNSRQELNRKARMHGLLNGSN